MTDGDMLGWVMEVNGPSRAEEFINAFLVPFSRGHRLSNEGDRALKLCALLAFPPPPPGSVVRDVDLSPCLEAVGPEQLSGVVLDLAEGYAHLPSGLHPNCRVIVDELLPALEELTWTPKCTWCLYPSPSCACGSVQAQAQCRARDLPEDPPPPYQRVALTTIGSTPQPTTGTLSSHAQAPGRAYFQQGIMYPTPIMGTPEDPPPMWSPAAAEQGLRPTIEPCSQSTVTTTQRAVSRMPPPPGYWHRLQLQSLPLCPWCRLQAQHPQWHLPVPPIVVDTTASTGPSASSSSQRESRGHGQVRLQGSTQVGSSQAGTQQSSQRWETEACPVSRTLPVPDTPSHLSPSPKGGLKLQQPLKVTGRCRPQLTPPPPLQRPNRPPHKEMSTRKCQWTPLRCALRTEPPSLRSGGNLVLSRTKAPTCPRARGGRQTTPPSSVTSSEDISPTYPWHQLRPIYEPVLRYLGTCREFWARLKEEDPLQLIPYLAAVFKRQTTLALPALAKYKKWIKAGSFYHGIILRREELNHTPHLVMAQAPNMNLRSPNEDALISHRQEYKAVLQQADMSLAALAKAQTNLLTSLAICRKDTREVKTLSLPEPLQVRQPQSGAGDATGATSDVLPLLPSNRVPTTSKRQKRQATSEADRPGCSLNSLPLQVDGDRRAMVEILLNMAAGITHATSEEVARYFQTKYPRDVLRWCSMWGQPVVGHHKWVPAYVCPPWPVSWWAQ